MKQLLVLLLLAGPCAAQTAFYRHTFSVGFGAGLPQGRFGQFNFTNGPALLGGYSYRPHRNFQLEAGVEGVFRTDKSAYDYSPRATTQPTKGSAVLVPLGARVVLPAQSGRVLFSVGGGAAHAQYTYFDQFDRSGWGYHGAGGLSVALDSARHFRLGVEGRYYRIPNNLYLKEQWVNVYGVLSYSPR